MGRFKAGKPRRERFRVDGQAVDEAAMWAETARMANRVDDHGRILFWDDPALQLGELATGIDPATGRMQTAPGESGQMPAALFEPERAMLARKPGEAPTEGSGRYMRAPQFAPGPTSFLWAS
ncbi:hypothetical protein [Actinacidiphila soli]|uniref:hypothetical protein n=1 Tax=Actinacidiphila soli TaxID=2487275 RepID=UPI000FCAFD58|nr:hypothetical protein [Actinacidiphila soli]